MRRSYVADSIIADYKRKQVYQNKERQNCKEKKCQECKYMKICTDREIKD